MIVKYKVMGKNLTSIFGVVCEDEGIWKFINKEQLPHITYDNAKLDSRNSIHIFKRKFIDLSTGDIIFKEKDVFSRYDGRIITYEEFELIKAKNPKSFADFVKARLSIK